MRHIITLLEALCITAGISAQESLPTSGADIRASMPSTGAAGPNWGSPWGPPRPASGLSMSPSSQSPDWQQGGILTVMACGYDAQGVWRVLPLRVNYDYNGIGYDVEVINAWNPWSDTWDLGVDVPAVNTSYSLRGNYYDFYVVLSTGTYYFNL